jgi:hypothetical protein
MGFGTKKVDKKDKTNANDSSKFNMANAKTSGKEKTKTTAGGAMKTRGASRGS